MKVLSWNKTIITKFKVFKLYLTFLDAGYPQEKSFKLFERKAECHDALFTEKSLEPGSKLDDGLAAIDAYKESIKMVSKSNLSKEKLAAFVKSTKDKIQTINGRMAKLENTDR